MNPKINWIRIVYIFGVAALIIGVLDPLEGSVVIALGGIALAVATYLKNDPFWKMHLISALLIITGVSFLFWLSSLGGFGGNSSRSWWWGMLILPYPLGWLMSVVLLIIKIIRK